MSHYFLQSDENWHPYDRSVNEENFPELSEDNSSEEYLDSPGE